MRTQAILAALLSLTGCATLGRVIDAIPDPDPQPPVPICEPVDAPPGPVYCDMATCPEGWARYGTYCIPPGERVCGEADHGCWHQPEGGVAWSYVCRYDLVADAESGDVTTRVVIAESPRACPEPTPTPTPEPTPEPTPTPTPVPTDPDLPPGFVCAPLSHYGVYCLVKHSQGPQGLAWRCTGTPKTKLCPEGRKECEQWPVRLEDGVVVEWLGEEPEKLACQTPPEWSQIEPGFTGWERGDPSSETGGWWGNLQPQRAGIHVIQVCAPGLQGGPTCGQIQCDTREASPPPAGTGARRQGSGCGSVTVPLPPGGVVRAEPAATPIPLPGPRTRRLRMPNRPVPATECSDPDLVRVRELLCVAPGIAPADGSCRPCNEVWAGNVSRYWTLRDGFGHDEGRGLFDAYCRRWSFDFDLLSGPEWTGACAPEVVE